MKHCLVFASLISPSKMILFEKKYHQMKHCISCLIYYFKNPPKVPILKSSPRKIYLPNFPAQKNAGSKNFKPRKILQSSPSLEFWSTPLGIHTSNTSKAVKLKYVCSSLQEAVIN